MGLDRLAVIAGRVAEQRAVVELGRAHDLAGIEQRLRIEAVLHLFEGAREARAEHRLVEFRAHQPVAVLAGMRALVFAHHGEGLFGDRAHGMHVFVLAQVEHRPHVQAAGAGMRVPGAARAVLVEDRGQARGVFGQMLERHRAILDEGDRFALLLHRHHDVEAGGAHLGDRGLQGGIERLRQRRPICRPACPSRSRARRSAPSGSSGFAGCRRSRRRRTRPAAPPPARRARICPASGGKWGWRARARSWCGRSARPRSA